MTSPSTFSETFKCFQDFPVSEPPHNAQTCKGSFGEIQMYRDDNNLAKSDFVSSIFWKVKEYVSSAFRIPTRRHHSVQPLRSDIADGRPPMRFETKKVSRFAWRKCNNREPPNEEPRRIHGGGEINWKMKTLKTTWTLTIIDVHGYVNIKEEQFGKPTQHAQK